MIEELTAAIKDYQKKWQALVAERGDTRFFESLKPTAVAYKTVDLADYDAKMAELRDMCDQIFVVWMNERWIAKLHLRDTALPMNLRIIKLMQRRPDSKDAVGLDHVDFYTAHGDAIPVLVEDAQLSFTALGNLPGPFIKWFIDEIGYDGLMKILDPFDDRSAHGRICYALYDGTQIRYFEGDMYGKIAREARGKGGFGFDSIFINDGFDITRAEMIEEDYARTSYRKIALDKLKEYLAQ
jgi:non-canonical purine NTP pyrophosphatase (RdgB/HAM1 family)